jgi:hypothetical protein
MDLGARDAGALGLRQHGADLDQRLLGRARHGGAAEGPHHARAGHQRHDLVSREHQRRKLEALPHQIADTGLAIDRHAGRLQVGDVAVDGALRHLQPLGQHARRHQPPAPQLLHDLEQAVGTAHVVISRRGLIQPS